MENIMPKTKVEIRKYGNMVEVREYLDKPLIYGYQSARRGRARVRLVKDDIRDVKKIERARHKSICRAIEAVQELCFANVGAWKRANGSAYETLFITCTFDSGIADIAKANMCFMKFMQRWRYQRKVAHKLLETVKSFTVPEVQADRGGAIHYHVLAFNVGYVPIQELEELWGYGQVHIQRTGAAHSDYTRIAGYVSKDFAKTFGGCKKRYFTSRGLKRATRVR